MAKFSGNALFFKQTHDKNGQTSFQRQLKLGTHETKVICSMLIFSTYFLTHLEIDKIEKL